MRASALATLVSALLVLSVAIPIVGTGEIVDWDDGCSLKIGVFVWEVVTDNWVVAASMAAADIARGHSSLAGLQPGTKLCRNISFEIVPETDTIQAIRQVNLWGETIDVIVGATQSAVSMGLTVAASTMSIPCISFGSTSDILSSSANYPSFSRVVPKDTEAAAVLAELCKTLNFTRVGLFYQSDVWGSSWSADFATAALDEGIRIEANMRFEPGSASSIQEALKRLADQRLQVIIAITYDLEYILDAAEDLNLLRRPDIFWMTTNALPELEKLVESAPDPVRMRQQLTGWLSVNHKPLDAPQQGIVDTRINQVRAEGAVVLNKSMHDRVDPFHTHSKFVYDAMWLAAISGSKAKTQPVSRRVELRDITGTVFQGLSGTVRLLENGDRSRDGLQYAVFNFATDVGTGKISAKEIGFWTSDLGFIWTDTPVWPGSREGWQHVQGLSLCEPGYFLNDRYDCVECPAGTSSQGITCVPCGLGTVASQPGSASCTPCNENQGMYADLEGMSECVRCPANSAVPPYSPAESMKECQCHFGYFLKNFTDLMHETACTACPAGATCSGGDNRPIPAWGFWADKTCTAYGGSVECGDHWDMFFECQDPGMCIGGANFSCAKGKGGKNCLQLQPGFFEVAGGGLIFECDPNDVSTTVGSNLAIAATSQAFVLLTFIPRTGNVAAIELLQFMQLLALIETIPLRWRRGLNLLSRPSSTTALQVTAFRCDFVSRCQTDQLQAIRATNVFSQQILLPVYFMMLLVLIFSLKILWARRYQKHEKHDRGEQPKFLVELWSKVRSYHMSILLSLYTPTCLQCFKGFKCSRFPDGHEWLDSDPSVRCWVGGHWAVVIFSVGGLIFMGIGLPMLIFVFTRRQRLANGLTNCDMSFVYARYRTDWIWLESLRLLRNLIIIAVIVFHDVPVIQGVVTIIVLLVWFGVCCITRRLKGSWDDIIEIAGIFASILYTLCGLAFFPSLRREAQGMICPPHESEQCELENDLKSRIAVGASSVVIVFVTGCLLLLLNSFVNRYTEIRAYCTIYDIISPCASKTCCDSSSGPERRQGAALRAIFYALFADDLAKTAALCKESEKSLRVGNGEPTLETMFDVDVMRSWSTWLSGELTDEEEVGWSIPGDSTTDQSSARASKISKRNTKANLLSKSFTSLRDKLSTIEAVSEYGTSSISIVVNEVCSIHGLEDWLVYRSTEQERKSLAEVLRGIAVYQDENNDASQASRLIRPEWRPTFVWFMLRSNAKSLHDCVHLFNSMQKQSFRPLIIKRIQNKVIQNKGGNRVHTDFPVGSLSIDGKQHLENALPMTISSIIQVSQNSKDFFSRMYNHSRRQYIRKSIFPPSNFEEMSDGDEGGGNNRLAARSSWLLSEGQDDLEQYGTNRDCTWGRAGGKQTKKAALGRKYGSSRRSVTIMHGAIDELNPQKGWGVTQGTTTSNVKLGWGQQDGLLLGQTEDDGWGGRHPLDGVDSGSQGYLSSHPSRSRDSNQSQSFNNFTGGGLFAVNFGAESDASGGSAVSAMFMMPRIQPNVTKIVLPTTPAKSPRPDIGEMESLASIPNLDSEARFTPTRLGIRSKSKSSPSTLALVNQSELQPTFEDAHSGPNLV